MEHILFARAAHEGQLYGTEPYEYHLSKVEHILIDFGFTSLDWQRSAWLHDVIEDAKIEYEVIKEKFGSNVADRVWSVTGVGANRKERNASIYSKIVGYFNGSVLKLADRIANVEQSVLEGNKRTFQMYLEEDRDFREAAHLAPDAMHERLDVAFRIGISRGLHERS